MKVISLTNQGGVENSVNFGTGLYSLVTTYNYQARCWTMDILDGNGNLILAGIMLVPNVDLLYPYPAISALIGSLVIFEYKADDYQNPDQLGANVQLGWYPPI